MRSFSTRMPRLRDALTVSVDPRGRARVGRVAARRGRRSRRRLLVGCRGWESLLGDRPAAQLGGRWIVVLAKPSLATKVAAAGGTATEAQERGWTAAARSAQNDVLARLAFHGAPVEPEQAYYRVFNGFAAPLDARALAIIAKDPDVKGVFPVRTALPAAVDLRRFDDALGAAGGRRADVGIPGFSGAGVTIALLDTGVDRVHPYIRSALLPGIDVLDPGGDASAGRIRRHRAGPSATAPKWPASSSAREVPAALRVWRPARRCFRSASRAGSPTRRAGCRSTAGRISFSPVSSSRSTRTRTVMRTTLRAWRSWVWPSRSRRSPTGPLAAAAAGASILDTLVVSLSGNDGPAGTSFGSVGGPGGAPAALTAGAIDTRQRSPRGHVFLLAGLRTVVSGAQPLGGVVAPDLSVSAPVVALRVPPRSSSVRRAA